MGVHQVRIEIDGEDVGIAYRIDLLDTLRRKYCNLSTARKKNSRITSITVYNKEHEVHHGVRIYNARESEMFEDRTAQEEREKELREAEASDLTLRRYSDSRFFDEEAQILSKLETALNTIRKGKENSIKTRGVDRRKILKENMKKARGAEGGLFARIRRWLKGDKGYKR